MVASGLQKAEAAHLSYLDGLRGFASVRVFIGHVMMLTGWMVPVVSWGGLAVDLFLFLSGFLMTYQAPRDQSGQNRRRAVEPLTRQPTGHPRIMR